MIWEKLLKLTVRLKKTRIIDTSHIAKKKTEKLEKKDNREHGKAYLGRYYDKEKKSFVEVMKEAKVLGDRCKCKAAYYHCKEISDQDREKIFTEVWRMTWCEKEVFVKMAIEAKDVKERKGAQEHTSPYVDQMVHAEYARTCSLKQQALHHG